MWDIPRAVVPRKARCVGDDLASVRADVGSAAAVSRCGATTVAFRKRKRRERDLLNVLSMKEADRLSAVRIAVGCLALKGIIQAQGAKHRSKALLRLSHCVDRRNDILNLSNTTLTAKEATAIISVLSTLQNANVQCHSAFTSLRGRVRPNGKLSCGNTISAVNTSPISTICVADCVFLCSLSFLLDAVSYYGVQKIAFSDVLCAKENLLDDVRNGVTEEQRVEVELIRSSSVLEITKGSKKTRRNRKVTRHEGEGVLSLYNMFEDDTLREFCVWAGVERQMLERERHDYIDLATVAMKQDLNLLITSPEYRDSVLREMNAVEGGEVHARRQLVQSEMRNRFRVNEVQLAGLQARERGAVLSAEGTERTQLINLEEDNFHLAQRDERERQRKQRSHRLFLMRGEESAREALLSGERSDYAKIATFLAMAKKRE